MSTSDYPTPLSIRRRLAVLSFGMLAVLLSPMPTAIGAGIRLDATLELIDATGGVITRIEVEIADTPLARARGLMHRSLPNDESGMLFVFPKPAPRSFWMRNTPESLDILFADAERRIIHIARETRPMSDQVYASGGAAQYVLETRAGFAARHEILPGARFNYYPRPLRRQGVEQP